MKPRLGQIAAVLNLERRRASSVESTPSSELFRAMARLYPHPHNLPVFFKVFDPSVQGKAHFNEILGHQAALQVGLPVPPEVRVCACRRDLFPHPSRALRTDRRSRRHLFLG